MSLSSINSEKSVNVNTDKLEIQTQTATDKSAQKIQEIITGLFLGGVYCRTEKGEWENSSKKFQAQLLDKKGYITTEKGEVKIDTVITCLKAEGPHEWRKEKLAENLFRVYVPMKDKKQPNKFDQFIRIASGLTINDPIPSDVQVWFEKTFQEMDDIQAGKNVYVHCRGGVTRSAALVVAYLIKRHNMSYENALQHVASQRPVVHLGKNFEPGLQDYAAKILENGSKKVESKLE